ncbi:MAG: LEA type 2 family protein [Phycisphaerales bacterium]|nr:LEA type 2 family protein [Phycisphaerales bacterium]
MRCASATALLLLAGLTGAGCRSVEQPRLEVVEARIVERAPTGVVVEFTLEGDNPNAVQLPMREVSYALEVDGRRVFSGQRSAEATLRRLGSQRFLLPAVVPASEFEGDLSGAEYRVHGTVVYLAPGAIAELLFDTGLSRPTVSFSGTGVLPASN